MSLRKARELMGKLKYPEASSYAVGVDEGSSRLVGMWGDDCHARRLPLPMEVSFWTLKPGSVSISRQAV